MTQIQIDWSRAQETKRHNIATENQAKNELVEANRHNIAYEVETNRHNVVTEKETKRHDVAGEHETRRHNVKTESIETQKLAETTRHNKQSESIEKGKLTETTRHNKQSETIEKGKLAENTRHNKQSESVERSKVHETSRHNVRTESQQDTHLTNETKYSTAKANKYNAEAEYTKAKTDFQKYTNSIDKSDPTLFKANRFSAIFKKGAGVAWTYYGLELASKKQKQTLDDAAKYGNNADKAVAIIDSLNYQKNGKHLSREDKAAWKKIFTLGKSSRDKVALEDIKFGI